jgi:hypothetical protein
MLQNSHYGKTSALVARELRGIRNAVGLLWSTTEHFKKYGSIVALKYTIDVR